jgi:hypothetical protein
MDPSPLRRNIPPIDATGRRFNGVPAGRGPASSGGVGGEAEGGAAAAGELPLGFDVRSSSGHGLHKKTR